MLRRRFPAPFVTGLMLLAVCGLKGRTRLAVLDGVVGATEMEFLVASLGDRERAVVVGKALTDDAEARLRELSPGSRVRHAPHELLRKGGRR